MGTGGRIIEARRTREGFDPPRETLLAAVESGRVVRFSGFAFDVEPNESALVIPAIADPKYKNISLDASSGILRGVLGDRSNRETVRGLLSRYFRAAESLVDSLFPQYRGALDAAPTSLRLQRVETRQTSWRKDDSRLHVDAFPSRPNHGKRILRVFLNIHPAGVPRVWRIGEPFEAVAAQFLPRIRPQWPAQAAVLAALKVTKGRRSEYDHYMLRLHDAMKADRHYQRGCDQQTVAFASGDAWVCFSDQVPHAAMCGQFMLEQTFFLEVTAMADPDRAPLAVLERRLGRALV